MKWLYDGEEVLYQTLISCLLLFISIVVLTRIVGLRSFTKITAYDFAFTIAIGSILSSVLTSNASVVNGSVAILGLLLIKILFSFLQKKSPLMSKMISNSPLLLMDGNKILHENLKASNIEKEQLIAKLREANVAHFDQVHAVVLETTGDISVIHSSAKAEFFDKDMLLGVRRK